MKFKMLANLVPIPRRLHRSKPVPGGAWLTGRQGDGSAAYSGDRGAYRRWPRPTPRIPALRRRAPTVRFITFETLVTGVRAFECAFSVRTSSFVHGLMTRRAVVAFTVLADFVVLTAFFKALGIIQGTPFERRSSRYAMWRQNDRRFDVLNSK